MYALFSWWVELDFSWLSSHAQPLGGKAAVRLNSSPDGGFGHRQALSESVDGCTLCTAATLSHLGVNHRPYPATAVTGRLVSFFCGLYVQRPALVALACCGGPACREFRGGNWKPAGNALDALSSTNSVRRGEPLHCGGAAQPRTLFCPSSLRGFQAMQRSSRALR